jgi:hypothetical protein
MINVITCGLTDKNGNFNKKFKLSSEVGIEGTQASIIDDCLTSCASNINFGPDDGVVEFAKDIYNVVQTAIFSIRTLEESEAYTEMFCDKVNKLVTTVDVDDVAGAAEFLDKISDLVIDNIDDDDVTVTVISSLLEKK